MLSTRFEPFTEIEEAAAGARQLTQEFVDGVLGRRSDSAGPSGILTEPQWRRIFCQLSRAVELGKSFAPGERLIWTAADLDEPARAQLFEPWLDHLISGMGARLEGSSAGRRTCWPDNRPFALCLTHDMDHVTSFTGREQWRAFRRYAVQPGARPAQWINRGYRSCKSLASGFARRELGRQRDPFGNVGQWLRLEADYGFKSSLFFFAERIKPWHPADCNYAFGDKIQFEGNASTVGEMMREIARRGWDIGLHGSLATATQPGVLRSQKRQIEEALEQSVLTTRQHYLEYDPARTPALQAEAGFLADGTQGFNDTIGFRAGTSFLYRLWDWNRNCQLPLWEIPLHIQDGPLLRHAPTLDQAVGICCQFMDRVAAVGGCLGLLFHPAKLATELGLAVYREILAEAARRHAWGCSMREAAECWQEHLRRLEAPVKLSGDAQA